MKIPFDKFAREADSLIASAIAGRALRASEVIVRELQKAGPQWSGRFSNSWTIISGSRATRPSQSTGLPQDVEAPRVTGREILSRGTWLIRIENVAPHAAIAMDLEEGSFARDFYPNGPIGASKWITTGGGRRQGMPPMKRGEVNIGEGGQASSTAPLDWYTTFKRGGKARAIVDKYFKGRIDMPQQYTFLTSATYRTRDLSD